MNENKHIENYIPWPAGDKSIVTTASGLQYIIIKSGDENGAHPKSNDNVRVHYEGYLASDGSKFDSSHDRGEPAVFPAGALISGWVEALALMRPGDEWILYIPSDLGYGTQGTPGGPIPPDANLIFRVALMEIVMPLEGNTEAWANYTPWNSQRENVIKTDSGLEYIILASGDENGPQPSREDIVVVHYDGRLAADGVKFDSSFDRGVPATFPAGALISGWVEALALMRPGDHWMLHIPSQLGYGVQGTPGGPIPPNADLNFEVMLIDIKPMPE